MTVCRTFAVAPAPAAAIESLPGKYFEAMLLRYFNERSIDEMADKYSLARNAVKTRLFRPRQRLQAYFENGCSRCTRGNAPVSPLWSSC